MKWEVMVSWCPPIARVDRHGQVLSETTVHKEKSLRTHTVRWEPQWQCPHANTRTPALKVFTGIISSYYLFQEICPATWECASVRHRFSAAMDEEECPKAMQLNFWGQKKKRLSQARWAGAGSAQRTRVAADANTALPGVPEVTWDPLPERQPVLKWFWSLLHHTWEWATPTKSLS